MEYMSLRDLRILAYLVKKGRTSASELYKEFGSAGAVHSSLNRLIALGLIKKIDRGEYEATDDGRRYLVAIARELTVQG